MSNLAESKIEKLVPNPEIRAKIEQAENMMRSVPGHTEGNTDNMPLNHTLADGLYIREIFMPKGTLTTTKIHRKSHPYFILKGEVSVLTESGTKRIKAPFQGITPAGTKRLIYVHSDTTWITVHPNPHNIEDMEQLEKQLVANSFEEFENHIDITTIEGGSV